MKQRVLILLLTVALILSACGQQPVHVHSFSQEYAADESHHWRPCDCGEKGGYAEHKWDAGTVVKEATEMADGEMRYTCQVCKATKTEPIEAQHTHSWDEGVVTVAPTTESEGIKTVTCTVCGYEKTEKIDKITPDHTHTLDIIGSDEQTHWQECACGAKDQIAQHVWDNGVVTVAPTTEREGTKTVTCTVCGYEKTEKIDRLDPNHTHTPNATGSDEHAHWQECACGAKDGVTAHTWNSGEITTPATDVEAGIKTFTCSDCGRKATEVIPAATPNGMSFLQSTHYRIPNKLAKTPLTVEAEIYVPTSQTGRAGAVFGNYYGIRQDWLFEIHENGVPRFYYTDAAGNVRDFKFTQVDVRTGDWVHIALTIDYENKALSLYLNGTLVQTLTIEADLAADVTRYQFVLGGDNRSNNGIYFKGQIRSVAAYSDIRTAEEIAASAKTGVNLYADDLLVAYLLNENSAGKEIVDLANNGYDIPVEWLDSHEPALDYAYSFAVVGDTQWLSKYATEKMEGIYDWILANKDSKKIAHVFGLGDITEDWNTANKEREWITAQKYISKLDGVIPYSLIRGNHDETKYFNKYFANETYMSQFDGFMVDGDIRNSYKEFTIGSTDYLFLTLDYGASDEMLAWANEVVLAHPNHRVIITTHGYHGFDGNHLSYDNTPSSGNITDASDVDTSVGNNTRGYNNGVQIWEKFISKHPNIFLVMSGHTPDEDVLLLQSEGNHGNIVNQMLIDPQWMDPQKNGVGMVCMLYFSEDGTQMEVEWISTDTGKYYKARNQFALDLTDSLNAPAHDFKDTYDEKSHHKACDCGYIYDEEPHEFDGGVLNADGFMVYSCTCGYQRIASATNDPVALELQALLEKYYNSGVYYKSVSVNGAAAVSTFYQGDQFWTAGNTPEKIGNSLTLKDLVLGKAGDLRLDLGWNLYEGVYSSTNQDAVKGVRMFLLSLGLDNNDTHQITKVTVEDEGNQLRIGLWAGDSLYAEATVGYYATTTLVTHAGETLDVIYTPAGTDGLCRIEMPAVSGYVAEYDYIILSVRHDVLEKTVYYSTVAKWDGKSASTSLKGSGTLEDPYLVETGADLQFIANEVNKLAAKAAAFSGKYFKLTQSIDLGGHQLNIGSYPAWGTRQIFAGFFDGNHCTIRGLQNKQSLFGAVEGGWLKNLSVYGAVQGTHEATGGIVAYVANGGMLENLTSYVSVNGVSVLGGVVGNAESKASDVVNCVNYGTVTGSSWNIGGITGSGGHNITNCVNYGTVTSTANDCVGGIAGSTKNTGAITNCYNYGTVNARGKAGGIVGQANKPIRGCVNYGDVNGTWALGGILGYVAADAAASITDCVNYGNVSATSTGIGGIFGILYNSATATGTVTIDGCVNNGSVSGTWGVGGIAGDTLGVISGCINNGEITAKGDLGGIIGKCYGEVTGCVNNGAVVGTQVNIGGIVGRLHNIAPLTVIKTTNQQSGTVTGPDAKEFIGLAEGEITASDNLISINHRGWYEAPENTLAAYRESYNRGWKYVECDVQFTVDGVAVLLHDDTIDRTSNGTGVLSQMTYAQVSQFDFSYDDNDSSVDFSAYRGEKIPTFEEFIALCKELGLHPYIEIKGSITDEQAQQLVQIVSDAGMLDNVSWLSFSETALAKIVSLDRTARIVWVITNTNATKLAANNVPFAQKNLMTGENVVVFDLYYTLAKQDVCDLLQSHGILLEVWTVNDTNAILQLNPYVSGVTSDKYNAQQVVAEAKANLGA